MIGLESYSLEKAIPVLEQLVSNETPSVETEYEILTFRRSGKSLPFSVANAIVQEADRLRKSITLAMGVSEFMNPTAEYYYKRNAEYILKAEGNLSAVDFVEDYFRQQEILKRKQVEEFDEFVGDHWGLQKKKILVAEHMNLISNPVSTAETHITFDWLSNQLIQDPSGFLLMGILSQTAQEGYLAGHSNPNESYYGKLLTRVHLGMLSACNTNYRKYYNYFKQQDLLI